MKRLLIPFLLFSLFTTYSQDAELVIRQGHKSAINMVKYSPTGKHIYSAGEDKSIKMWDVSTGIDVNTLYAHEAGVITMDLSEDGKWLVSGDRNGTIIVWDAITGAVKTKIDSAHIGAANTVKLTKDLTKIISGGEDELIRIWSITGDSLGVVTGFSSPIKNLAISPSGDRIVTGGGKDNGVEVKLVDLENQKILADALDNVKGSDAALIYTKVLMTGFAVVGNVANGRIGKESLTIFTFSYSNMEFTDDGKKILISQNIFIPFMAEKGEEEETGNASASIIELSEDRNSFGEVSKPIRWSIPHVNGVALFNQDQTKVIVNEERSIKVYDIENADFPEPGNKEATQYVPPVVKEIKGITKNTNWLALSPDYRTVVTSDDNRQLKLYDFESGRKIRDLEGFVLPALSVDVMPDGKHILVGSKDRNMTMWDITTGQMIRNFDRSSDVNHIDVSANGQYMVTTATETKFLKVWNFKTGRLLKSLMEKKDDIVWVKFNPEDDDKVWALTEKGDLVEWSLSDYKSKKIKGDYQELEDKYRRGEYSISFEGYDITIKKGGTPIITDTQKGIVTDAVFSVDSKFAITTNESGEIALYHLEHKSKAASMALIGENEFITYTPDFYYTSSKGAAKAIAFKSNNQVLPFEQLELRYNRPDIVVGRLGYAENKLIASYKAAYEKRIKRLGFTEEDLNAEIELPVVSIDITKVPLETDQKSLTFDFSATDKKSLIKKINVYVNDVPVFGSKGMEVNPSSQLSKSISLELSGGLNEIKVTAVNQNGQESLPTSFEVQYTADFDRPDLYLVSIGVSEYQQSKNNLAFAAKDATDLVNTLKESNAYKNVNVKLLTNQEATDENIKAVRSFIQQARVDDVVIVFIAGHGVLDDTYTYYFATNNMDFNNPSNGGLSYEALEAIIDGITCRNKILMMDTCHSGELDAEDVEEAKADVKSVGSVAFRSTGSIVKLKENSFGLENTLELSKALFGDMKKGTGATVISAAGGTEFAAEGVNSANGLFTSCFIKGLTTRMADWNRDRSYTVSEIQNYVSEQVILISNGKQVPTSREENIKNDFRVY